MFTTTIDSRALAAIALFSSKGDDRERLNGVTVEWCRDGRPLLMATDGHRLAAMPGCYEAQSAPKHVSSMILRIEAVNEVLKGADHDQTVLVQFRDNPAGSPTRDPRHGRPAVSLKCGRTIIEDAAIYCDPVEWRQVLPNGYDPQKHPGARHEVGVNADYLASFAKALKVLGHSKGGMALQLYGPQATIIVRFGLVPEFLGIVMPLRDSIPQAAPTWMLPVAALRSKAVKAKPVKSNGLSRSKAARLREADIRRRRMAK